MKSLLWGVVALFVVWIAALWSSVTMGGLIHVLPVAAVTLLVRGALREGRARDRAAREKKEADREAQGRPAQRALGTRPIAPRGS